MNGSNTQANDVGGSCYDQGESTGWFAKLGPRTLFISTYASHLV